LLAASRDDHPQFGLVHPWFDALLAGDEPYSVPVLTWHSFLRLAAPRRIFPVPTPRSDAA
jgi:predicted nucleic acid-binding protein